MDEQKIKSLESELENERRKAQNQKCEILSMTKSIQI